jgi:hypothetical protein
MIKNVTYQSFVRGIHVICDLSNTRRESQKTKSIFKFGAHFIKPGQIPYPNSLRGLSITPLSAL